MVVFTYQTSSNVWSIRLSGAEGAAERGATGAINLNEVCDWGMWWFMWLLLLYLTMSTDQTSSNVSSIRLSAAEGQAAYPRLRRRCQGYYQTHTSSSSVPIHFERQETTVLWCWTASRIPVIRPIRQIGELSRLKCTRWPIFSSMYRTWVVPVPSLVPLVRKDTRYLFGARFLFLQYYIVHVCF